jgi:hypothetical protein
MAGQGSLCQLAQSARWNLIASGLRSTLTMAAIIWLAGGVNAQTDQQAESTVDQRVRIESHSGTSLHVPDSKIEFSTTIDALTQHASQRLHWRVALFRASDGEIIGTDRKIVPIDSSGHAEKMLFEFSAPDQPGVYEVRFELSDDDENLWQRFRKTKPPIVRIGRPIFVVPASDADSATATQEAYRLALLHLPELDWVETFIDRQPHYPSTDDEFLAECDPSTVRALQLWTAIGRLGKYVQKNGMSGVVLSPDSAGGPWQYDQALFPSDTIKADRQRRLGTLRRLCRARGIPFRVATRKSVSIVRLPQFGPDQSTSNSTKFKPLPEQAALAIAARLSVEDPALLAIELPRDAVSLDHSVREMLRTFSLMPRKQLSLVAPVDPANGTVQVRIGVDKQHGYVALVNLAPWATEIDLDLTSQDRWNVVGDTHPEREGFRQPEANGSSVQITLQPGQLALLKTAAETSGFSIRSWSAVVSGGAVAVGKIKGEVTSVVERIGLLSNLEASGALTNGGFEQSGGIGLVGWMHAQHPPGCVRIDQKESIEGKHSVLLTTDPALSARTWIVSETLDPPESGRLAVSLVMRAERVEGSSPHQMRVSVEATRNGEPIRYTGDFKVSRNGQWGSRQIVLETDQVEKQKVDALRLTIDSLSKGRVWLDDVRVHHWFPTVKEREELQSQAFLAVQGLQNGNLTPSSRLLQNQWARYLLSREPSKDVKPFVDSDPEEKPMGVAERIRSWLPRPIRF